MKVIFHADDFGISVEQSERILACSSLCGGEGVLNSLSVLVNSPCVEECSRLLYPHIEKLKIGIHFNFVEGQCCSDPSNIPLLVNHQGFFSHSFFSLMVSSMGPSRSELRSQLRLEAAAQLKKYLSIFPMMKNCLRVDSHQHFHLIPLVWDSVLHAIKTEGCDLEYIRVPSEPLFPYLATPRSLAKIPPINCVKHCLLKILWQFRKGAKKDFSLDENSAVFFGINFSGCMDMDRMASVLRAFERYAGRRGRDLEVLFHPGGCTDEAEALNPNLRGFVDFYISENRNAEATALRSLEEIKRSV